jgi:hypothetical protein
MDKSAAMKRLDAIEAEAKQLRELISEKDRLIFDRSKLYVGMDYNARPYIMVGNDQDGGYYRFHNFMYPYITEQGWSTPHKKAQECLDVHVETLEEIKVFSNVKEGFNFFLAHYKE